MSTGMRRIGVAASIFIGVVIATLVVFAIALPSDATRHILEVRNSFRRADVITTRADVREIALRDEAGSVITTFWLRRPQTLRTPYRIVITYAGADTGEAILDLIPPQDDLVVAAVQYPWKPPHTVVGRVRAPYDIRQAAYRTVAGGILAVDYLEHVEHLDPSRIVLLGASLGSIFATIHGSIDRRVPQIALVHGGAGLADTLAAGMQRVPAWLRPLCVRIARIPVDTFDPAHYVARIAPRNLLIIAARNDRRFPPQAVLAFYNHALQPKELRWTDTVHVGKRNRQVVNIIMAELNAYLRQ